MANENPLKVACYGAGYFSQFHFDAWGRISGAELVGIANRNQANIPDLGIAKFADVASMLNQTKADILDIITPPITHLAAIKQAVDFGVKAIICQKPFCENIEDAKAATKLAADADIPLVIHENFRFQPWYRLIKSKLEESVIGELLQFTFRLRTGDGQGKDAYLDRQPFFREMEQLLIHETGAHWVDTFHYLFGAPKSVYADIRQLNPVLKGEDAGFMLFEYDIGKRALFDGNRLLDHNAKNCRTTFGEALVEGTEGTIYLHGNGSVTLRKFGAQTEAVLMEEKRRPGFAGDCVYALQKHVIDGLVHGAKLENEAHQYLKIIEIEEAVYRSASEHRKVEL